MLAVRWLCLLAAPWHLQSSGEGCELCLLCQSALCLCEAQKARKHRTPLGLAIISSSAKVASLILTASSLAVLPRASCKTEEMLFFSVFCLSQAAALRVLQGFLHRRHNELFCWQEPLGAAAVQPSKTDG